MTQKERMEKCKEFFKEITKELEDDYEVITGLDKQHYNALLIPKGTKGEVNYYGKPINSFRVALLWNWKASIKRCKREDYIQCENISLMKCKPRKGDGLPSNPIYAWCVAYYANDCKYHTVYGSIYNNVTHEWEWLETSPEEIVNDLRIGELIV